MSCSRCRSGELPKPRAYKPKSKAAPPTPRTGFRLDQSDGHVPRTSNSSMPLADSNAPARTGFKASPAPTTRTGFRVVKESSFQFQDLGDEEHQALMRQRREPESPEGEALRLWREAESKAGQAPAPPPRPSLAEQVRQLQRDVELIKERLNMNEKEEQ